MTSRQDHDAPKGDTAHDRERHPHSASEGTPVSTPPTKPIARPTPGELSAATPPAPGHQTPPRDPDPRPSDPKKVPPQPQPPSTPPPQRPGRPKGQLLDQRPVTAQGAAWKGDSRRAEPRPAEHVTTDSDGKTYEGKTGVSGETAESADETT
jgi:hypothetical protein